jgi:transposase-like protein
MISKWFKVKPTAITLCKNGLSINAIEEELGIPRCILAKALKMAVLQ